MPPLLGAFTVDFCTVKLIVVKKKAKTPDVRDLFSDHGWGGGGSCPQSHVIKTAENKETAN